MTNIQNSKKPGREQIRFHSTVCCKLFLLESYKYALISPRTVNGLCKMSYPVEQHSYAVLLMNWWQFLLLQNTNCGCHYSGFFIPLSFYQHQFTSHFRPCHFSYDKLTPSLLPVFSLSFDPHSAALHLSHSHYIHSLTRTCTFNVISVLLPSTFVIPTSS